MGKVIQFSTVRRRGKAQPKPGEQAPPGLIAAWLAMFTVWLRTWSGFGRCFARGSQPRDAGREQARSQ